jgi:hypothetical protein
MAGRSLAAAAVLLALLPARSAAADSVSGVQASIAALQSQVTAQATEIHTLTSAYQAATLQSASLSQQITAERASLTTLRAQTASTRSALRNVAVRAYTDGQSMPGSVTSAADASIQDEYLAVASGDVGDTVDRLQAEQRQVRTAEQTITQAQQANAAAVAAAAQARSQALATAGAEQTHLASLQAQLQQLVTAQSVAQAQAAAAAAKATQGAPVNGGLVSVVRTLVSTPATTAAPATAAPSAPSAPATAPPTTSAPPVAVPSPTSGGGATAQDFAELRQCESGDNYTENTGNGFYGAYQFGASTWTGLGFPGRPDQEPPAMQDQAAEELQARSGWGQWPACSAALGLS